MDLVPAFFRTARRPAADLHRLSAVPGNFFPDREKIPSAMVKHYTLSYADDFVRDGHVQH